MGLRISTKQNQYLKGLAHSKKPVIQIGKGGVSENVLKSTIAELNNHELIKVQFLNGVDIDLKKEAAELARQVKAHLVQIIGFKVVLYRPRKEEPKIVLP